MGSASVGPLPSGRAQITENSLRGEKSADDKGIRGNFDELDSRVSADEVHTSSWMPNRDRGGAVFQQIYDRAWGQHEESAAKGLTPPEHTATRL